MTINELAKAVHENAVAHGWWKIPPTIPEALCLIHSEVSEALEEYREGNPVVYGTCALAPENCKYSGVCDKVGDPDTGEIEGPCKPEGLAVELADVILRALDLMASLKVDAEAVIVAKHRYNLGREYKHGGKVI